MAATTADASSLRVGLSIAAGGGALLVAGRDNRLAVSVASVCIGGGLVAAGSSPLKYVLVRQLRRRPVRAQLWCAAGGIGVGASLFALGAGVLAAVHSISITWSHEAITSVLASLAYWSGASAAIAVFEEVLCRSYILDLVAERSSIATGVVVSSAIFGLLHLPNEGASYAAVTFLMVHGLFFAACRFLTGDLSLAIGAHMGWNLAEGGVFGANLSGLHALGVWRTTSQHSSLLNGGAFGPEAGIVTVVIVGAAAVVVFVIGSRRRAF